MKFSLSACVLALSFLSTAHAACHQRSRRSYGAALIPTEHQTNKERDLRRAVKQVVRRHKSGRRADLERRQPGNLRQTYEDRASGGSWWDGPTSSSTGGSQAVNLADTGANSWSSSASASAATGSATAAPSTSSSAPAASSSSSSSSSSGSYSGQATFFYQNGVAGACGTVHADSDAVVALDTAMYGSGSNCGRTVTITNTANGKTVTATVADECPTCSSSTSLDLSTGAFDAIGDEVTGELPITWSFAS
ncbi:hypothetical protein JCM8202_002727 [Rhodotorula sphaerocarpa]